MKGEKEMTNYEKFKVEQLEDSEFKKEYDSLEVEYDIISQIIKNRLEQNLTQADLARKVGTAQSNISRLESGNYNPTLEFLEKVANSLGKKLKVSFI